MPSVHRSLPRKERSTSPRPSCCGRGDRADPTRESVELSSQPKKPQDLELSFRDAGHGRLAAQWIVRQRLIAGFPVLASVAVVRFPTRDRRDSDAMVFWCSATEPPQKPVGGTTAATVMFPEAVQESEEVVPVNVSTWVLPSGVMVGR